MGNTTATSSDGDQSIHSAAKKGERVDVESILSQGAGVDDRDGSGHTALHYAAQRGHLEIVKLLVQEGANVNTKYVHVGRVPYPSRSCNGFDMYSSYITEGWTALHYASAEGHLEVVKFLIKSGANADVQGCEPLHNAAQYGHKDVAEFFLNLGAIVDSRNEQGCTPLHYAAWRGDLEMITLLVEKGANVNSRTDVDDKSRPRHIYTKIFFDIENNSDGWTALHFASVKGHLEVVTFLTKVRADVNVEDFLHRKPIHFAADGGHKEIIKLFLDLGVNVDSADFVNSTPLYNASRKGHLEVAKFLTERGADPNVKRSYDDDSYAPLHVAAMNGHKDIVELLLNVGANVDSDDCKFTPLYSAVCAGHLEVVKLLVDRGANINAERKYHGNSLSAAVHRDRKDILQYFLNLKVDLNIESRNSNGWTPLHFAAAYENLEIMKLLVERGANIRAESSGGMQPIHLGTGSNLNGNTDVIKFFLNLGTDVNAVDNKGWTPLHYAAVTLHYAANYGNLEVITVLVENNGNIDKQDKYGRTPLMNAMLVYSPTSGIAEYLIKLGANFDNIQDNEGKTALHYVTESPTICTREFLSSVLQNHRNINVNVKDGNGNTPLSSLIMKNKCCGCCDCAESVDLLIEAGAYLSKIDCERIIANPSLKEHIMQNVELCLQVIVNKFNNEHLPELYKLVDPGNLPPIENMRIRNNSNVVREIECTIDNEIQSDGCYNLLKKSPITLTLLSMDVCISSRQSPHNFV